MTGKDKDLIIEALRGDNGLKIMCACLALQKQTTLESFFLEQTHDVRRPKKGSRIVGGRLQGS